MVKEVVAIESACFHSGKRQAEQRCSLMKG